MKSLRFTLLSSFALVLLAPCFHLGVANAQGSTGKFTLASEARWGLATLPAGDYWFRLDYSVNAPVRLFRGNHRVALVYAQSFAENASGSPALVLVSNGTGATVREMRLPNIGKVLYYAPHSPKHGTATEERRPASWFR
jgi:hypothetical protein